MTRTFKKFAAWLAFLGIAFTAIWPVVATALPSDPHRRMVDCPHTGMKMLDLSGEMGAMDAAQPGQDSSTDDPPTKQPGKMQCVLCASGVDHAFTASSSVAVADDAVVTATSWWLKEQSQLPRYVCLAPPSQAPPAFS